ncbi:hypothetical protein ACH492_14205 [Streptomyces sp. NPDC019443]|uniref:hypothetical protein n=1 Tax=Streptomyces sp. NPDC019443 TaxID=3365061 RepID=UPI0037BC3B3E
MRRAVVLDEVGEGPVGAARHRRGGVHVPYGLDEPALQLLDGVAVQLVLVVVEAELLGDPEQIVPPGSVGLAPGGPA